MGRAARQRSCPALGQSITPEQCATGRLRTIDCPEGCSSHAFSPSRYDDFLDLESRLDGLLTERLMDEPGGRSLLMEDMPRFADPEVDMDEEDEERLIARLTWLVFGQRDASGQTRATRWLPELRGRLDSDGQILLERMAEMYPALFEVRQVLDEQTVEAVDLLDPQPKPVRLRDRGLAEVATRFLPIVAWTYPAPFVRRLHGVNAIFPVMTPYEPREILTEIARHLGGPTDGPELRAWTGENLGRLIDAVAHIDESRRRASIRRLDAVHTTVTYRMHAPLIECLALLDAAPDIDEEEPDWQDYENRVVARRVLLAAEAAPAPDPEASPSSDHQEYLGILRFRRRACRLTAMGAAAASKARARLQALLGSRIEVIRERERDIAARLLSEGFTPDPALVPPTLAESPGGMNLAQSRVRVTPDFEGLSPEEIRERMSAKEDQLWLDLPVPALGDRTPREAATDPQLRPRMLQLLKARIRQVDAESRRTGRRGPDLNGLLATLGADELVFPAPPVTRRQRD